MLLLVIIAMQVGMLLSGLFYLGADRTQDLTDPAGVFVLLGFVIVGAITWRLREPIAKAFGVRRQDGDPGA